MENKVKVWLAREANGVVFVHFEKPHKTTYRGFEEWVSRGKNFFDKEFPSVKREDDEPTEAYITLAEPQEQPKQEQPKPKQEIDWEQRRNEIAKEMMDEIYRHKIAVSEPGQAIATKDIVDVAVIFADMLINKLREKSE